ncbi:MAG: hypothetical protein M3238_04380 [Actinomycetota bacterium]|nr:hypothetical protein [Actinomycetota bacterium]
MGRRGALIATIVVALSLSFLAVPSVADTSRFRAAGSDEEGWRWRPRERTIGRGDRIVWTNPTSRNHTVTAYGGNWSKNTTLGSGERTAKRFRRRGTFRFRCVIEGHSALEGGRCFGMCGKVVVR